MSPGVFEVGKSHGVSDRWIIESPPPGLIYSPIDYFFAEHHRQRQAAAMLIMIAEGERDEAGIERLTEFLETAFAQHIVEEETALFPWLRSVCLPEDDIESLLSRLALEHGQDEEVGDEVLEILRTIAGPGSLGAKEKGRLRYFAEHLRRHIALENGVLLPIARARITSETESALVARLIGLRGPTLQ
jgi:hemerythrin-like domain-containing protein